MASKSNLQLTDSKETTTSVLQLRGTKLCHNQVTLELNPQHQVRSLPAKTLISACETLNREPSSMGPWLPTYKLSANELLLF